MPEIFTTEDARRLARRRQPRMVFDFIDGAAGNELGNKRNQSACTRAFRSVAGADIDVTLDDGSGASDGRKDSFTRDVVDLFGGAIEDRG